MNRAREMFLSFMLGCHFGIVLGKRSVAEREERGDGALVTDLGS